MGIYDNTIASRSRDNELADIGLTGQDDLRVGFGERFASSNSITFGRYTPVGRDRAFSNQYEKRDKILIDAGLISEPLSTTQRILNRQASGNYPSLKSNYLGRGEIEVNTVDDNGRPVVQSFEEYLTDNEANDELLLDLKNAHPELDIKSDEEIASLVMMDQLEMLAGDEDLAERSNFLGKVGFLTGSMIGWLRDPTHAVSSLVGITPQGRLAMSANFLRVGAAEASVVAALEISEKPTELEFRREFGEPELTTQEVVLESAIATTASALIGGGIGAVIGKFLRPIPKSVNNNNNAVTEATQNIVNEVRTKQAAGFVFDPEAEQATNILDEMLQVSRNSPANVSYETHMDNYGAARRAVSEGTDVAGPDDIQSVVRGSDQEVVAPAQSETIVPRPAESVQDRAINDLRASLEIDDVIVTRQLETGELAPVSSRETLASLDAEDAAVRATIDCLG